MPTDINALDQHIGDYVRIEEGEHGMEGFLIQVADQVGYQTGKPTREIMVDYGYGFPVSTDTVITVLPEPHPLGAGYIHPADVMDLAMHRADGTHCPGEDCPNAARAAAGLHAFRIWQMKQDKTYWRHHYVTPDSPEDGDAQALQAAVADGASPYHLDVVKHARQGVRAGWVRP